MPPATTSTWTCTSSTRTPPTRRFTLQFFTADGAVVTQTLTLAAQRAQTLRVDTIAGLESTTLSTIVDSTAALPLVVERTLYWDGSHLGGHAAPAVDDPQPMWSFAEGAQGAFDTYLLLFNPNPAPARVTVHASSPVSPRRSARPTPCPPPAA